MTLKRVTLSLQNMTVRRNTNSLDSLQSIIERPPRHEKTQNAVFTSFGFTKNSNNNPHGVTKNSNNNDFGLTKNSYHLQRRVRNAPLGGSSHHSIRSISSEITDDDSCASFAEPEDFQLRSCMKGSREKTKGRTNLRIRFKLTNNQVIIIEPFFQYANDLWYSKFDTIERCSADSVKESVVEYLAVKTYMAAYTKGRNEVYNESYLETLDPMQRANCHGKLSSRSYKEIAHGRSRGLAGLEHFDLEAKNVRKKLIKETILKILCVHNNFNNISYDEASKRLRSCSKGLTQADRYWATAMGNADAEPYCDE